jgi:hypothetical protein
MRDLGALFGKIFILLIFACGVSMTQDLGAEDQMENEKSKALGKLEASPKVQFDELYHDLGKAFQHSTLKHTFTFKNVGTGILHIKKPKAS